MIPRADLKELLESRLKGRMSPEGFEDLLHEIEKLEEAWEEVNIMHRDMGYSMSVNCPDICFLAEQIEKGEVFKMFRRKKAHDS